MSPIAKKHSKILIPVLEHLRGWHNVITGTQGYSLITMQIAKCIIKEIPSDFSLIKKMYQMYYIFLS